MSAQHPYSPRGLRSIDELFDLELFHRRSRPGGLKIGMPANLGAHTRELCGGVYLAFEDAAHAAGWPAEVVWLDDHRQADAAERVAREYVRMGVRHVVGHLSASAALAAAPVYAVEGVLFLAPGTSHPELTAGRSGSGTTFRLCGRDDEQGAQLVSWARSRPGGARVALVEQEIEYGQILSRFIRRSWNEHGLKKLVAASCPREGGISHQDMAKLLEEEPRLIIVAGIHEAAAEVLRLARSLGYRGEFLLGDDGFTPNLLQLAGDAAEGAYVLSLECPPGDPRVQGLVERYRRLTGADVGAYFLSSYTAATLLLEALAEAGSQDPGAAAEVLRSRAWQTPVGTLRFSATGEVHGIRWQPWQVVGGRFVPLETGSEPARPLTATRLSSTNT